MDAFAPVSAHASLAHAPILGSAMPVGVACTIASDPLAAASTLIEPLYRAITAAAHPDCPACAALLPVLAGYLGLEISAG